MHLFDSSWLIFIHFFEILKLLHSKLNTTMHFRCKRKKSKKKIRCKGRELADYGSRNKGQGVSKSIEGHDQETSLERHDWQHPCRKGKGLGGNSC